MNARKGKKKSKRNNKVGCILKRSTIPNTEAGCGGEANKKARNTKLRLVDPPKEDKCQGSPSALTFLGNSPEYF